MKKNCSGGIWGPDQRGARQGHKDQAIGLEFSPKKPKNWGSCVPFVVRVPLKSSGGTWHWLLLRIFMPFKSPIDSLIEN